MSIPFLRVGAACPKVQISNTKYNSENILYCIDEAYKKNIKILVFPELCTTAYTCADLFFNKKLIDNSNKAINNILLSCKFKDIFIILGAPIIYKNSIFNCAVTLFQGKILGIIPKSYLPNSNEFYEKRWFTEGLNVKNSTINLPFQKDIPFGTDLIFTNDNIKIACEICEDLWVPIPPSSYYTLNGANIICNLSASNELINKNNYKHNIIMSQSLKCICAYIYSSSGVHESSTDSVFGGELSIYENGEKLIANNLFNRDNEIIHTDIDLELLDGLRLKNNNFKANSNSNVYREIEFEFSNTNIDSLSRNYNKYPFLPTHEDEYNFCDKIIDMQCAALAKRLEHTKITKLVLGISGGLDSTLALLSGYKTLQLLGLPSKNLITITMPGFGTTDRTYNNALLLCKSLNTDLREINISKACIQHFKDINHNIEDQDVTYENVQARERTQILMDIANKEHGLVLGTGDLSEIALGWSTFNGDHMSMYSINCSIPKTLVKYLVEHLGNNNPSFTQCKNVLLDIVKTPISPELLPKNKQGKISQKTQNLIGPYELHDFFLYHFIIEASSPERLYFLACETFKENYDTETIKKWLNKFMYRFITMQFKRSTIPDGPKITNVSLSPRGDLKLPSDASYAQWLIP